MAFSCPTLITLTTLFACFLLHATPSTAAKRPYIVYMGAHSHGDDPTEKDIEHATDFHHHFLASFLGSHDKAKDAIFYSYNRHINGFAAILEEDQVAEIANHPEVVSVFLSKANKLHTSHSWEFMMLERNGVSRPSSIWNQASYGEDVIIAHLDTGVWPESKSFSGDNYGPVPSRWKGNCKDSGIPCNRKLIGAKYYCKGLLADGIKLNMTQISARDDEGHGSHTLSTAGGNFVDAKLAGGLDIGVVKGGSPRARVATYKVCWDNVGCYDADMLAAFDQAIHDGVDVISVSIGGGGPMDYSNDTIAIAAFHAVKKGIFVSASAGNSGPIQASVLNAAPWIITVAASTLDRDFQNHVELHNSQRFMGKSLSAGLPKDTFYALITGEQARSANTSAVDSMLCKNGTLDRSKVEGKIIVCLRGVNGRVEKGLIASAAGAAGMILCNDKIDNDALEPDQHFLPASHITYKDGLSLLAYMNSTSDPLGYITTPSAVLNQKHSPSIASFSSRGPNPVSPEILKPDITAPGVNIIAAWSEFMSPTELGLDNRTAQFSMISGTSMSCPHVAGAAGLLKSLHPDWSPAAIRSALTTSARSRDNTMGRMLDYNMEKATPFMYGSGHLRPNAAMDPGLVYDLTPTDYLDFLCSIGYNDTRLAPYLRKNDSFKCNDTKSVYDFNYPSISLPSLTVGQPFTVTRKVKNVGPISSYSVDIRQPDGVRMSVDPSVLIFEQPGQEITYTLTVTADSNFSQYVFGGLTWSDGTRYVRSPVAIKTLHS